MRLGEVEIKLGLVRLLEPTLRDQCHELPRFCPELFGFGLTLLVEQLFPLFLLLFIDVLDILPLQCEYWLEVGRSVAEGAGSGGGVDGRLKLTGAAWALLLALDVHPDIAVILIFLL